MSTKSRDSGARAGEPRWSGEVRRSRSEREVADALALRRRVFVGEQGVEEAEEFDDRDHEAVHLVALSLGHVIGTCRLLMGTDRRLTLGRMAVQPQARRRGIAQALLLEAKIQARAMEAGIIVLHAQTYACPLYRAAGFEDVGETFMEAGMEHVRMEFELA